MSDLMTVWSDIADRLAAAGIAVQVPTYIGWADAKVWGPNTFGCWEPDTERLLISDEIAHAPSLVHDVMVHEVAHQIQYECSAGRDSGGINGGPHGDLFIACATKVAAILGCPSPVRDLVIGWPYEQRPDGYFGPFVSRAGV